jgi:DNA-binding SARP family transcriptional activator
MDFLILGEFVILVGGRPVSLPGPSVRALLSAVLLTPGDVVGEDRLLELAWGPGKGTRRALQCAANRLREWLHRTAGPGFGLGHTGSGYRLTVPDEAVDLVRFRRLSGAGAATGDPELRLGRLRAALDEWRGPVLGGRPDWLTADPFVRAVEQARIDCAGALADAAIRLGRPDDAVAAVRRVAEAAPYDEPLQARLVRLLSTSGRSAEALRHVENVRRLLADELGTAPSRDLRVAHAVALQRDDRHSPVPQQLPPDVADFTGRDEPVRAITDRVLCGPGPSAPLVFGINGPAGAGTSTLAVHVAHRLAPVFVDGQLYADLRGPASPGEVLDRFLRALGVAGAAVPGPVEDRIALYRSRTAGCRLLVVLDNAADEDQVRPLVPGAAGCAVLVAGRIVLTGLAGARPVPLGPLAPAEAVALLGKVSGRDGLAADPACSVIAQRCGHLPLAVRVAGVRLATRPMLSPSRLADLLGDEDRRLDELAVRGGLATRPSLAAHYGELSEADRTALRRLALLRTASFPPRVAAALLDTSVRAATELLEALVDARLVDTCGAGYGLPELVAVHARERARAEDTVQIRQAALRRVALLRAT